jgi:hypothetical protein
MVEHPEIDTSSIEWYEDIKPTDNRYIDPIHWVQEILPAPYRKAESFLVAPSIGTVTSIQTIQDKEILTNFLVGNIEGYQEYLQE